MPRATAYAGRNSRMLPSRYGLGFRTFVLQGGEDYFYSDDDIAAIVRAIKAQHPDCAVTLSIGERSRENLRSVEKSRR